MRSKYSKFLPSLVGIALAMFVLAPAALAAKDPTVTTGSATVLNQHEARLQGWIQPHGEFESEVVTYGFEFGPTTEYGSETELGTGKGASFFKYSVNKIAKGLKANTTYHYRIGAYAEGGNIVYGEDKTFTTPPPAQYQADQYPATLSGTQDSSAKLVFGFENGMNMTCNNVSLGGTLGGASGSLSVAPAFGGCKAFGLSATVAVQGCTFTFGAGEAAGDPASMGIGCSGGEIEITAGTCRVTIPGQSGLSSVAPSTEATSPNKVKVDANVSGIAYTKVKDGFLCPLNGTGSLSNGSLSGTASIGATDSSNTPIGLRIK